jgi:hypothetical protein
VLGAIAPAAPAQEELEVTLQVLDDVTAIEGVLMPLEEVPAHPPDSDSDSDSDSGPEPAPDASSPAPPADDRVR